MGRVPYSEFVGSRARLQRLTDQRVYSAWVEDLGNDLVRVSTDEVIEMHPRDRFLFQLQGPSADAYFLAEGRGAPAASFSYVLGATAQQIVNLPAHAYDFELITQIQMRDGQQLARRSVGTLSANMRANEVTSEVLVTDASAAGMGVLAWQELKSGDSVEISLESPEITATFACDVRHCRPEPHLIGAYRIGLQFREPDRVAVTSWRKLVNPL